MEITFKQHFLFLRADIDECAENSHNCDHVCHNNIGSFTCTCNAGSTLADNGYSCLGKWLRECSSETTRDDFLVDINECANPDLNGCQQVCNNTAGSYVCDCNVGYILNADLATCSGVSQLVRV